jgi:hypothetical protein
MLLDSGSPWRKCIRLAGTTNKALALGKLALGKLNLSVPPWLGVAMYLEDLGH